MAGACEYGNELSGCSIKCGGFLDYLQNQLASQEGLCCMEQVSKFTINKYTEKVQVTDNWPSPCHEGK